MFNKFPKQSGIYHISDNIEQFELQVHFRHVNSLLKLPKFDFNKNVLAADRTTRNEDKLEQATNDDSSRLVRIKWQQKLLSPSEMELYKEMRNCTTDQQKKYNQWLIEEEQLFKVEDDAVPKKGKTKKRTKKTQKLEETKEHSIKKRNEIFTYVHEDNFVPDADKQQTLKNVSSTAEPVETMYIYAALNPDTQLVSLRWHPQQRMLHIYPDFCSFHENPYFIEIDLDYRHLYAYGFENISKPHSTEVELANGESVANFLQVPELQTHWQAKSELAAQFEMPPKRTERISLLFEIHEAYNFEYDNIHVRYHVKLPPNTILEEGLLDASTHSSRGAGTASGCCSFGYTWQLTLLCEEYFNSSDLLHIYFELISIDSWERERIEGYAHYSTYLKAGRDSQHLQCLRPADSFLDSLNRYFIGGRQKFDFVGFFTDTPKSQFHSRMLSTGKLHFTCQRLSQRNCELLQPCRTNGMTLDDIMLAYREARRRLEAVALK